MKKVIMQKTCGMLLSLLVLLTPVVAAALTVHVYESGSKSWLEYRPDEKAGYRKVRMLSEHFSWMFEQNLPDNVRFGYRSEYGPLVNLGGVLGEYPGDPPEDFSAGKTELWLKDMLLFPYNPAHDRPDGYLSVLTLNMHTYQEKQQQKKFEAIAAAISKLQPDIVCLQECAQDKNTPVIAQHYGSAIRSDNMALLLTTLLRNEYAMNYDFYWDWSHYGWDRWEEGVAILSRHRIARTASRYVSGNSSRTFWKSRNIACAEIETGVGKINVFSAHMGWWGDNEEPYRQQFDRLTAWKDSIAGNDAIGTVLCGDFNEAAGSEGYYSLKTGRLSDCYLESIPEGMYDATIGGKIDGWKDGDGLGKRIDYIFRTDNTKLVPVLAQRIFTEKCYGRVSDHTGVYVHFKAGGQ